MTKTVFITGGAQGIGKGIVFRFLSMGWNVVATDIDTEAGDELVRDDADHRHSLLFIEIDVRDEIEIGAAFHRTMERFGQLDAVVNNAGIADPYQGPVEDLKESAWQRIIDTNLGGVFRVTKHAVPFLRQTRGSIVNIASTRALQSEPHTEAYAASKGGIVALTHALAVSLGPEIRVNCISPGWIDVSSWKKSDFRINFELSEADHQQHPVGRVGLPQDIAGIVAFLVSDDAGFITGQNLVLDGGMTKKMIYVE